MPPITRAKVIIEAVTSADLAARRARRKPLEDAVAALESDLKQRYPQLDILALNITSNDNPALELRSIKVNQKYRGSGVGTQVIDEIKEFAQRHRLPVTLSPAPDYGKKEALHRFYRRHGFRYNRGRYADYRYTSPFAATMLWRPE